MSIGPPPTFLQPGDSDQLGFGTHNSFSTAAVLGGFSGATRTAVPCLVGVLTAGIKSITSGSAPPMEMEYDPESDFAMQWFSQPFSNHEDWVKYYPSILQMPDRNLEEKKSRVGDLTDGIIEQDAI
jgi:hypothetical protein